MRIRNWIGLMGAALLATACAGGRGDGPPPGFGGDDDAPGQRTQLFISPSGEPYRASGGQPYPSATWFAKADTSHDGRLTQDEFRADADSWFKALDANDDGQISMPEVTRWEEALVPEMSRVGVGVAPINRRSRNVSNTRLQGAAGYSLINEPHPIRGADADFSFGVSRTEWRVASDRRFALLDPDGDGSVALVDLRATPAQAMSGHGSRSDRRPSARPPGRKP
jgi:EF hand